MANSPTPTSKIILSGKPSKVAEAKIETAAGCYSGSIVKKGTTDDDVVCGTAVTNVTGVIIYEDSAPLERPVDMDTLWTVNKRAKIAESGNFEFYGWLGTGCTAAIVKGDPLIADADGNMKNGYTAGYVIAYAAESTTSAATPKRIKANWAR
jgi:hypothetical protein